jgi:HK97 family phage major capsid protein
MLTAEEKAALVKELGAEVAKSMIEASRGSREGLEAVKAAPAKKAAPGIGLTQSILAFAHAKFHGGAVTQAGMVAGAKAFGANDVAKTLQESVFASGGSLLAPEYSSDFIDLLRPVNVFERLGATFLGFSGELILGRQDSGATAYWVAEGNSLTVSTQTTGQLKLMGRKMGVLCYISNQLLRKPQSGAEALVLKDIREAARVELETQGVTGAGSTGIPKGIKNLMDQTQSFTKAGTSIANYIADLDKLVLTVDKTNRPREKRGFLMSPDLETALLGLRDAAGWVFRTDMLERGMLRGMPYATSTLCPTTHLFHGEWSDFLYGIETDMEVKSWDGDRIAQDETTVRLIMGADFQVRRPKSFAAINNY